jgi:microcystin-dependent protein
MIPEYLKAFILLILFTMLFFFISYVRRERIEMQKEAVVGDMKYSARTADYPGWLVCDGRSLDRSEYRQLFQVIGTTYGSVSVSKFNLPDCRGRTLGAIGQGVSLTNRTSGMSVGEERHTMTIPELVSHTHTGTTEASGSHNHTGTTDTSGEHNHTGTTDTSGEHNHTGTTDTSGEHNHTHNANGGQNNLGLAVADGSNTVNDVDSSAGELNVWTTPRTLSINNNGSHTHSVSTVNNGSHTHTFTSANNGSHTHTFTSAINGSHTHTFTTATRGDTQPFNVMQPTIFVGHVFIHCGYQEE